MEILISVDIEGIAGVIERDQQSRGNPEYERARRLMTEEANAAAQGAFSGGADKVIVVDSHGTMCNIIAEDLHPKAELISGKPRQLSMIEGISKDCDGIVLIGWHARAGGFGQFAHTISSATFREITINNIKVGEATLFAGYAASLGIPFLATSGDDFYKEEIKEQFPGTRFIQVKKALGAYSAQSVSPVKSRILIEEAVKEAVLKASDFKPILPFEVPLNVKVDLHTQHLADCACLIDYVKRDAAETVSFTAPNWSFAIKTLSSLSLLSASIRR